MKCVLIDDFPVNNSQIWHYKIKISTKIRVKHTVTSNRMVVLYVLAVNTNQHIPL